MSYPVSYSAAYAEERSRLTTFFRYILAIPHFFLLMVYGIGLFFSVVAAWFAIVFTGRYPEGLYSFSAGVLQYIARVNGYISLVTDAYPPFGLGDDEEYPVRLAIAPPPAAEYDRMKTLFRIILMIPVYLIAYVLQLVGMVASFVAWFWIIITGRQNEGLQAAIVFAQSYNMKAYTYYCLLTETWPPFSDEGSAVTVTRTRGGTLDRPESAGMPATMSDHVSDTTT